MTTQDLISRIRKEPGTIHFDEVIQHINEHYQYIPARFTNGSGDDMVINEAGNNEGSCKIFAFGQLARLSEAETLTCFGQYYRDDVLNNPHSNDHANIRMFIKYGWQGINFDSEALIKKP